MPSFTQVVFVCILESPSKFYKMTKNIVIVKILPVKICVKKEYGKRRPVKLNKNASSSINSF